MLRSANKKSLQRIESLQAYLGAKSALTILDDTRAEPSNWVQKLLFWCRDLAALYVRNITLTLLRNQRR